MEERASGIILRTRPLSETSVIVQWLTSELGRISTVAKGARRKGSPFLGKLDFCFEAEFSFIRSRRSQLHILKEVQLTNVHRFLRTDLHSVAQAAYFTVLIEQATEAETPLGEIVELFTEAVETVEKQSAAPALVLAFELRLLAILGSAGVARHLSPEASLVREALAVVPWEAVTRIPLDSRIAKELAQQNGREIGALLGKIPKQRASLLNV